MGKRKSSPGWAARASRLRSALCRVLLCAALLYIVCTNAVAWSEVMMVWSPVLLQLFMNTLVYGFVLQSFDKLLLLFGCFYIWSKPSTDAGGSSKATCGAEKAAPAFEPIVLVQIPMRNERECYKRSILAACRLDWPQDKLVIQILDDSDEGQMQQLMWEEVDTWRAIGAPVIYSHRTDRAGYKAGSLRRGMQDPAIQHCEYVAIFDADFVPARDFLRKTVPHFQDQPKLALVQARWAFANAHQNLLTRFQVISMSYHFEVEQQVQNLMHEFFGFNGTAGVWRIKALQEAGGWLARTTTEDMDIAVRAHMCGWKFTYLNDVMVPSEVPCTYEEYCKQQYRWSAGPVRLFMLTWRRTLTCPTLSLYQKFNLLVCFFWLRRFVLPLTDFLLSCVLPPLFVLLPAARLPTWFVVYVTAVLVLQWIPHRGSWCLLVPYYVFENVMHRVKAQAIISGLLNLSNTHVWEVTAKTGAGAEAKDVRNGGLKPTGDDGGEELLSPGSEDSSEDAFVADPHTNQVTVDDLLELGMGLKVRIEKRGRGLPSRELPSARAESPVKRRDCGTGPSPMKREMWSPSARVRMWALTLGEDRDSAPLTSAEGEATWRVDRTLCALPAAREVWAKVTWAACRKFVATRNVHVPELLWAAYMLGAMTYGIANGRRYPLCCYLGLQALGFLLAGLDLIGY